MCGLVQLLCSIHSKTGVDIFFLKLGEMPVKDKGEEIREGGKWLRRSLTPCRRRRRRGRFSEIVESPSQRIEIQAKTIGKL